MNTTVHLYPAMNLSAPPVPDANLDADAMEAQRRNVAPVPPSRTEATQPAFSGTSHKLDAENPSESVPVAPTDALPSIAEPKAVPKTPPPTLQMQAPPKPVESAAASTTEEQESRSRESEWNNFHIRQLRPAPCPNVPETGPPTVMPSSKPYMPEMPVIPADALAEDVDLTDPELPVFGVWKNAMSKAPHPLSRDAQIMENYLPLGANIEGFDAPVEKMMELTPASDCVKPPYPNFYLDGNRIVPCTQGLTGYDGMRLVYKGPLVFEEYWNRMI
eukprot:4058175-Amphidinium_carterae.1